METSRSAGNLARGRSRYKAGLIIESAKHERAGSIRASAMSSDTRVTPRLLVQTRAIVATSAVPPRFHLDLSTLPDNELAKGFPEEFRSALDFVGSRQQTRSGRSRRGESVSTSYRPPIACLLKLLAQRLVQSSGCRLAIDRLAVHVGSPSATIAVFTESPEAE